MAAEIFTDKLEFAAILPNAGILLGLDVGSHTIGTAFCDAGWQFASPASLIKRRKFTQDKMQLVELIASRQTKAIVIGLPVNMDGSESPRSQSTRAFAKNIADLGLPILLWDERWSTQAVERAMIDSDISRAKRAQRVDNAAAAFILQGAIDAMAAGTL
ncbi:Holliday junction DNA helicase RuvA [Sphingorhabdus lutea]|uniref:Putative pre-16S rRNA nuclease n=1 Tax=Sphingorhabdus lutea TaxID=1913578 RepID=A0A1L3JCF4_9SPHN|nr:Holliday junction resolvase RuvX [Sphingorhabdus lutea]APG62802.1 Holliday junction DNA helicase RuvA [Sphingorhabdus lutea]